MAENVTFVKKLEFAEAERARAIEEREALRVEWRQQTESWFAGAADEMRVKLLADWGAADKLQSELSLSKHERARSDAAHAMHTEALAASEASLRTEAQGLEAERNTQEAEITELRADLERVRAELNTSQHAQRQMDAQAEVRQQQVRAMLSAATCLRRPSPPPLSPGFLHHCPPFATRPHATACDLLASHLRLPACR